jgi:hypothetical protein
MWKQKNATEHGFYVLKSEEDFYVMLLLRLPAQGYLPQSSLTKIFN